MRVEVGPVGRLAVPAAAAVTVAVFLFAVQLLGAATDAAAPLLARLLRRVVAGCAAALGFGWVAAYVLANGSVVAALALSLFDAGLVSARALFLLVAGSRLGAAAVVVVVGALDYLGKDDYSLREGASLGLLTFLLTHTVYLPVTALGYLGLGWSARFLGVAESLTVGVRPLAPLRAMADAVTVRVGAAASLVVAVALLFGALRLFDRVLARADTEWLRLRLFRHLERPWLSAVVGFLVTAATTSVAFSVGVVVPLFNRGYVERREMVPYVLGANVGTLFDTLVVAVVLDAPVAVAVVLWLLAVSTLVTLVAVLFHDPYERAVGAVHDRLLADRRAFGAFLASLLVVPLVLLV